MVYSDLQLLVGMNIIIKSIFDYSAFVKYRILFDASDIGSPTNDQMVQLYGVSRYLKLRPNGPCAFP